MQAHLCCKAFPKPISLTRANWVPLVPASAYRARYPCLASERPDHIQRAARRQVAASSPPAGRFRTPGDLEAN